MKRIVFLILSLFCFGWLYAQSKVTKTKVQKAAPKAKYPFRASPVYLGHSSLRGGKIAKFMFDSLVTEGLYSIDSADVVGDVVEFRIYYKQRNLYEDSVGNYYTDVDMLTDLSKGNKLNAYVDMAGRSKAGDTAIFDEILVRLPDSMIVRGAPMKFVLTK